MKSRYSSLISVQNISRWLLMEAEVFCTHHACVKLPLNIYEQLSSGARCLNFRPCFYLHHSLCVRALMALAMLCTSTGASEN